MTPMCKSGNSTADQMSANSSERLWRQKKAEQSFGRKTGLIRYKTVNQTVSCLCVCLVQNTGRDTGKLVVYNPAGDIIIDLSPHF